MKLLEDAANYLITKGDIGVTILLAGLIIYYLHKGWRTCEAARLEDWKTVLPIVQAAATSLKEVREEMAARSTMSASFGEALRRYGDEIQKTHSLIEELQDIVAPRKRS